MRGRKVPWLELMLEVLERTLVEWPLTGDNASDITKRRPMSEGEHGERPPRYDRGGQNLPKISLRSGGKQGVDLLTLTGITFDRGPDSLHERYYP